MGRESLPLDRQVGLLVKPHDATHQRVRWVDEPTHGAPGQRLAWYLVLNKCLLTESTNGVLEETWAEMSKGRGM